MFHERNPYNVADLKWGIRLQKEPMPISKFAQDMLEQTEIICEDVRKNTMQAYIKYKAYFDKKANCPKLMEDYVYIIQSKADCQGSRILLTEFHWGGPYIIEKALP